MIIKGLCYINIIITICSIILLSFFKENPDPSAIFIGGTTMKTAFLPVFWYPDHFQFLVLVFATTPIPISAN